MSFTTTLVFYFSFGMATSVATLIRRSNRTATERTFQAICAIAFWPMFLPFLMQPGPRGETPRLTSSSSQSNDWSAAIRQAELSLDTALRSLEALQAADEKCQAESVAKAK